MTIDDPGDPFFGHLDDPTPPLHGGEALTHVIQRGQQIRRRRRAAYSVSSVAVVIVIAGATIGLASANGPHGKNATVTPLHTATLSPSPHRHSKPPSSTKSPTSIRQTFPTRHGHSPSHGPTAPATPSCVSDTPSTAAAGGQVVVPNVFGTPKTGNPATSSSPTPTPTCTPLADSPSPTTTPSTSPSTDNPSGNPSPSSS
jgi:hypothetical protein